MTMRTSIAVTLLALTTGVLEAQVCQGRPSFSEGRYQLGGSFEADENTTYIGGDVSVGLGPAAFARISLGRESVEFPGDNPSGLAVGGTIGFQFVKGTLRICPVASGRRASLDLPGTGNAALIRTHISGGIGIALERGANSTTKLVPFASVAFGRLSLDVDGDAEDASLGSDTYFPLTAGLSLRFGNSLRIVGDVAVPISLGDSDPIAGLRFVLPLGRP